MTVKRLILTLVVCGLLLPAGAGANISAGPGETCAVPLSEQVSCWGADYFTRKRHKVPVLVAGTTDAVQVSVGTHFVCAVFMSGKIGCWGDDGYGQLGDGRTTDSGVPVEVAGVANAVSVATGGFHACAVLASGGVACWGRNFKGALGNGSGVDSSVPVSVVGISNAVQVATGDHFDETCALLATGTVDCWGVRYGPVPRPIEGVTDAVAVAAGGVHACAVTSTGKLLCWRSGGAPETIAFRQPVASVSMALRKTCVVLSNGEVECWGSNRRGEVGNGTLSRFVSVPQTVTGIHTAVAVSVGVFHICAQLQVGAVCWGYNDYGDLGGGLRPGSYATPRPVLFSPVEEARAP